MADAREADGRAPAHAPRGIGDGACSRRCAKSRASASCPSSCASSPIDDGPLPIGEGQTISQPYIVALMIEAAEIAPGDRVLEVGAGSGYAAAVLSRARRARSSRSSATPPWPARRQRGCSSSATTTSRSSPATAAAGLPEQGAVRRDPGRRAAATQVPRAAQASSSRSAAGWSCRSAARTVQRLRCVTRTGRGRVERGRPRPRCASCR